MKVIRLIITIAIIASAIGTALFFAGRYLGTGDGSIAAITQQNADLTTKLEYAQKEIANLRTAKAALEATIKGGGDIEEIRQALNTRSLELDRREEEIQKEEQDYSERAETLRRAEQEFHAATNMTQQDIGEARQIKSEFEAMRAERDGAQALANRWLMFIWGISLAAFLLFVGTIVLSMRAWAQGQRHRSEAAQRRYAVQAIDASLYLESETEKRRLLSALSGLLDGESRNLRMQS